MSLKKTNLTIYNRYLETIAGFLRLTPLGELKLGVLIKYGDEDAKRSLHRI